MSFDFQTFFTIIGAVMGAVSLVCTSRIGALKGDIDKLRREMAALRDRLAIVENERDSHKRDADALRERLITALTENKALQSQLDRLKSALRARAKCK